MVISFRSHTHTHTLFNGDNLQHIHAAHYSPFHNLSYDDGEKMMLLEKKLYCDYDA